MHHSYTLFVTGIVVGIALTIYAAAYLPSNVANAIHELLDEPRPKSKHNSNTCRVVAVIDGDSIRCLYASKKLVRVRLHQIDAPEIGQAFGRAAKKHLASQIFNKHVVLQTSKTDRYGRTLAEVFVDDKNINKLMVRNGYAWAYRQYVVNNEYIDLEKSAKQARRGLWSKPNATNPAVWRNAKRHKNNTPEPTQPLLRW